MRRPVRSLKPARAAAAAWLYPSLRESMYRLTWWSVACLPGINVPPAIAGGTLRESSASHHTGHRNRRRATRIFQQVGGAITRVPPDATRLTRKQGAHSIFWKTTPYKVVFGCASCPKTRRNWLRLPIVSFHPRSSCPQQPPRGEATPAAERHFRAIHALVGIRSTFAVPHLAQSSEHPNTFTSFRRPRA